LTGQKHQLSACNSVAQEEDEEEEEEEETFDMDMSYASMVSL
jgi:hypothetical protein